MAKSHYTNEGVYPPPIVFYTILLLVTVGVGISIYSGIEVSKIKKALVPPDNNDFLKKITGNTVEGNELPLNIIRITSDNIKTLQSQIGGLDSGYIGKFLIQYPNKIVVYDLKNDKLEDQISLKQQQQIPADFFEKLYKHSELRGLSDSDPVGGIIDSASLATLKQQFPDVYKDAKVGDYLLRYTKMLVIYDYNKDKVVNAVALQP